MKKPIQCVLFIACSIAFAQVQAQETAQRRGLQLLSAFQSLDFQADRGELSGATNQDRNQIKEAINSTAWHLAGIEVLEAGCGYFNSTAHEDIDAARLAAYLAGSDKAHYAARVDFYEARFESLSRNTKGKFEEAADTDRLFNRATQVSQDRFEEFYGLGKEYLVQRYSIFCERLPEQRSRIESAQVESVLEI